jgi:flagellar hook assembly protein FlgD
MESGYPNPFNHSTTIPYGVTQAARVRIVLVDISGRNIRTLVDAMLDPGRYRAEWDGRDDSGKEVSSGAYLVRMDAGTFRKTRKLMLLR